MPLTAKGAEVMAAMKKEYGDERGERVFYASKNAGRITGVDSDASRNDAFKGETVAKKGRIELVKGYGEDKGYWGVYTPGQGTKPFNRESDAREHFKEVTEENRDDSLLSEMDAITARLDAATDEGVRRALLVRMDSVLDRTDAEKTFFSVEFEDLDEDKVKKFNRVQAETHDDAVKKARQLLPATGKWSVRDVTRADADDKPDAIKEAAKKAGESVEDYLARRKAASRGHLRQMQRDEMAIDSLTDDLRTVRSDGPDGKSEAYSDGWYDALRDAKDPPTDPIKKKDYQQGWKDGKQEQKFLKRDVERNDSLTDDLRELKTRLASANAENQTAVAKALRVRIEALEEKIRGASPEERGDAANDADEYEVGYEDGGTGRSRWFGSKTDALAFFEQCRRKVDCDWAEVIEWPANEGRHRKIDSWKNPKRSDASTSPEYSAALEKSRAAERSYQKVLERFRAKDANAIMLATAQKARDEARKEFDRAHAKEQARGDASPSKLDVALARAAKLMGRHFAKGTRSDADEVVATVGDFRITYHPRRTSLEKTYWYVYDKKFDKSKKIYTNLTDAEGYAEAIMRERQKR